MKGKRVRILGAVALVPPFLVYWLITARVAWLTRMEGTAVGHVVIGLALLGPPIALVCGIESLRTGGARRASYGLIAAAVVVLGGLLFVRNL